ncbi:HET-domain-containing protein [Apiospora saccharicola]|uniref:HET-domain-containing protein n=1 Tax=Apiospora saccharicola TaxID=335842 RepID=A0ABR1WJ46_9PEZI
MRLLNTSTLRLETFTDERSAPPYVILSHTWEKEITFGDIKNWASSGWLEKQGAQKVRQSAEQARLDNLQYIWIDTLCIDKSSSAELSEAINSMFKWYECSAVCYAYLFDITGEKGSSIRGCKWLSRGWTLQKLIAPARVRFYNMHWYYIGTRNSLAEDLQSITGIDYVLLHNFEDEDDIDPRCLLDPMASRPETKIQDILASISIASRMFWASGRQTTRSEEAAYCLMGLFSVNIPLLYGEGGKAFARLQEEIIKVTTDTSILVFADMCRSPTNVLAPEPKAFALRLPAVLEWNIDRPRMLFEKDRITLEVILCATSMRNDTSNTHFSNSYLSDSLRSRIGESGDPEGEPSLFYAVLDGSFDDDNLARPAILVRQEHDSTYRREHHDELYRVHAGTLSKSNPTFALYGGKNPAAILPRRPSAALIREC